MDTINLTDHPIGAVQKLAEKYQSLGPIFWFAEYAYDTGKQDTRLYGGNLPGRKGYIDEFSTDDVDLLDEKALREMLGQLHGDTNLAICSKVDLADGTTRHIGMIDFADGADEEAVLAVADTLADYGAFSFYRTGRSYHAYGDRLLTKCEWISFLGDLLLLNQKYEEPVVDWRWVGHKIKSGYGALRWSARGAHRQLPKAVKV